MARDNEIERSKIEFLPHGPAAPSGKLGESWYTRGSAGTWDVTFALEDESSPMLLETGARLLKQRPPGHIAVVMTGKLKFVWTLTSTSLGREAKITGLATEDEARDLALTLLSGSPEADLGGDLKGTSVQRDAESFVYYGMREPVVPQSQNPGRAQPGK